MNVIKIDHNKMENDFLTDSMMLFVEMDISTIISTNSIIDDLKDLKNSEFAFHKGLHCNVLRNS